MIHLDTSYLIRALVRGTPQDRGLRAWLAAGETLAMSTVGWAELLCGPIEGRQVEVVSRLVAERCPLDEDDASLAADLFNGTGRRRGSLGDCLIAATAIRRDAPLATANESDFRCFEGYGLVLTG